MLTNRVTAVFDNHAQAEQAYQALSQLGVRENHISIITQQQQQAANAAGGGQQHADDAGDGAGRGLAAGAGVGALFGLGAALIPGVGPFITAGTLLSTMLGTVAGGAVAGAVVGGTSGAIAGALARSGYSEQEAHYYGSEVERGGVFVAVDAVDGLSIDQIRSTLAQYGGRFAQVQ
jgi:uncharacterized membrane protein